MLGEFIAYYLGKAAGRGERPRRRREPTPRDIVEARVAAVVIAICAAAVVLVKILP